MYIILTNEQLDLASSYQRWQMETKGNVLVSSPGLAPRNDEDIVRENHMNTLIEIETYNLND